MLTKHFLIIFAYETNRRDIFIIYKRKRAGAEYRRTILPADTKTPHLPPGRSKEALLTLFPLLLLSVYRIASM